MSCTMMIEGTDREDLMLNQANGNAYWFSEQMGLPLGSRWEGKAVIQAMEKVVDFREYVLFHPEIAEECGVNFFADDPTTRYQYVRQKLDQMVKIFRHAASSGKSVVWW